MQIRSLSSGILQLMVLASLGGSPVLAQNVVSNGSFETGTFVQDTATFVPGSTGSSGGTTLPGSGSSGSAPGLPGSGSSGSGPALPGSGSGSSSTPPLPGSEPTTATVPSQMTLTNGASAIGSWSVGTGGGYVGWIKTPDYNPQSGSYAVSLKSYQAAPYSSIQQVISTTVGSTYEVSGYFASEANGGPTTLSVMINGSVIGSVTNGFGAGSGGLGTTNLVWTAAAFRFQATASTTTLRFQDATTGGDVAPMLDNVSVILVPIPALATQPAGTITRVGGLATFSITASGQAPLSYQWRLNGANISGATSSTLSLSGLTASQAGTYSVAVNNAFGQVISSGAALSLTELAIASGRARVTISGPINTRYRVEATDALGGGSASWSTLADFVLSTNPSSVLDSQINLGTQRYFKVTPVP